MPLARDFLGIGVDLVSWSRIQRFWASHSQEFLERLLTPTEQSRLRRSSRPLDFFARSFAAKEATFKAGGAKKFAEESLREIEITLDGGTRFRARSHGHSNLIQGEGEFFETPDGVGARVTVWKEGQAGDA